MISDILEPYQILDLDRRQQVAIDLVHQTELFVKSITNAYNMNALSLFNLNREYKTLILGLPRYFGTTTLFKLLAESFPGNKLMIFPNVDIIKDRIRGWENHKIRKRNIIKQQIFFKDFEVKFKSCQQVKRCVGKSKYYKYVIIDGLYDKDLMSVLWQVYTPDLFIVGDVLL